MNGFACWEVGTYEKSYRTLCHQTVYEAEPQTDDDGLFWNCFYGSVDDLRVCGEGYGHFLYGKSGSSQGRQMACQYL